MEPIQISSLDQLNEVIAANANVLLVVSRNACPGCDALARSLETHSELQSALEGVTIAVAKVEKIPNIASIFGLRQAPSMILFKDDEDVAQVTGFQAPAPLIKAVRATYAPIAAAA